MYGELLVGDCTNALAGCAVNGLKLCTIGMESSVLSMVNICVKRSDRDIIEQTHYLKLIDGYCATFFISKRRLQINDVF